MTDRPLADKIALVTGASRGIGAATAIALGKAGAHVILTARTAGGLEAVEEAIHEYFLTAQSVSYLFILAIAGYDCSTRAL